MADKKEKKSVAKTLQTVIITIAVIAVAAGSVAYGIHFVMKNEGIYELDDKRESTSIVIPVGKKSDPAYATPYDKDIVIGFSDYMESVTDMTSDSDAAKLNVKTTIGIPSGSVVCEDDAFRKDLLFASKSVCSNIEKNYYPPFNGVFGQPNEDGQNPVYVLKDKDLIYAVITEGAPDEEEFTSLLPENVKVVSDEEYEAAADKEYLIRESEIADYVKSLSEVKDADDYYYVKLSAKTGTLEQVLDSDRGLTFRIAENMRALQAMEADIAGEMQSQMNVNCKSLEIFARINRFTDRLDFIEYTCKYDIDAASTFTGKLEKYASQSFSFEYDRKTRVDVQYAGLTLNDDVMYIELGDEKEIPCIFNTEEEDEQTAVYQWKSENPEIAEVTENGFVTSKKISSEPVRMLGHAEYLGRSYDVVCNVYVIKPVENIILDEKTLSLKVGETHPLTYKLEPEDATITDALWFTEQDGEVVSVDENGVVTAVGAGTATVYAVSKNEHFKSSCIVTVE